DLGECTRCKLHGTRRKIVFGDGNPKAELVFVGEGPGADEDAQGLPFVGRAGKLLTQMIEAMGLQRKDVYICNVVKCRPPENRQQVLTSSSSGWRFSGGRHFTTLQMYTSFRCSPIASIICVSSLPARPTNGNPWASSSAPGPSPTKTSSALGFPSPKTILCRVLWSLQRVHSPRFSRILSSVSSAILSAASKSDGPAATGRDPILRPTGATTGAIFCNASFPVGFGKV